MRNTILRSSAINLRVMLFVAGVLLVCGTANAQAGWGDCYLPCGTPNGYGYGYGYQYGVGPNYVPTPTYFAIHPPVYYSHVINRRSYGTSPFAYPGTYSEPAAAAASASVPAPEPKWIINPFVKQAAGEAAEPGEATPPEAPSTSNIGGSGVQLNQPVAAIRNPFVR